MTPLDDRTPSETLTSKCLSRWRAGFREGTGEERGVVLMLVLWIMVFLSVVTAEFARSMKTEITITRNYKEEIEAEALANAGLAMAFSEILEAYDYNTLDPESSETLFIKKKGEITTKEETEETDETSLSSLRTEEFGGGTFSYSIVDEERKFNINKASRGQLIRLLTEGEVEAGTLKDAIADSILDWIDEDNLHRLNGVEENYYMALPKPYHCKNADLSTVDELLLVKEVTHDILYGGGEYPGISSFITISGKGKLNLNTASEEVLKIAKGPAAANEIISKRTQNDGVYDENQRSDFFLISSTGTVASVKKNIRVHVQKTMKNKLPSLTILSWNEAL
ncbi:MAG: general secretion pathway protein GspK [Nitrospinota bacterium]